MCAISYFFMFCIFACLPHNAQSFWNYGLCKMSLMKANVWLVQTLSFQYANIFTWHNIFANNGKFPCRQIMTHQIFSFLLKMLECMFSLCQNQLGMEKGDNLNSSSTVHYKILCFIYLSMQSKSVVNISEQDHLGMLHNIS